MLVLTSKSGCEAWASLIRGYSDMNCHVYTQSLPNRRKLGVAKLAQFDVVVSTLDVSEHLH